MSSEPLIRELDVDRDVVGVVEIASEAEPQWLATPESWRHDIASFPERAGFRCWVALVDDRLVGFAAAFLEPWTTRTDVGHASASVLAEYRRRGIGTRLADVAEEHAVGLGARRLLCWVNESDATLGFATARGYAPSRSAVHSKVDPTRVDAARLDRLPPDVRLASLADLEARLEEVYDVFRDALADEPRTVPVDELPFDEFVNDLRNPLMSWEATFCALERDSIASFGGILSDDRSRRARNGFTGTGRAYRGRGYATLAKLASIRWLAANGYRTLWTGNDETNAAMLAVNGRLGYRPAVRAIEVAREV